MLILNYGWIFSVALPEKGSRRVCDLLFVHDTTFSFICPPSLFSRSFGLVNNLTDFIRYKLRLRNVVEREILGQKGSTCLILRQVWRSLETEFIRFPSCCIQINCIGFIMEYDAFWQIVTYPGLKGPLKPVKPSTLAISTLMKIETFLQSKFQTIFFALYHILSEYKI